MYVPLRKEATLAQLLQCQDIQKYFKEHVHLQEHHRRQADSQLAIVQSADASALNNNNMTNKVSYILNTFSLSHDTAFHQEMRFPIVFKQDSAAKAWILLGTTTKILSPRHQLCLLHALRVAEERAERDELERRSAQSLYDLGRYRTAELEQLVQYNRALYHTVTSAFRPDARLHAYLAESSRCAHLHVCPPTPRPLHRQTIQAERDATGHRHTSQRGIEDALHACYTSLHANEAKSSSWIEQLPLTIDNQYTRL
ncbi:hypothetical protein SPRG_16555 [Saprolegnia parasitica CBS 223.65]|uniref:Uncharacterized protein n=1 Tax=Saprolegnia parasitica (strain CBS 223.65) TaxID=695850 RepID=A0A067BIC1_SAPPC|nr:hypothetical protein SPRG_16555 [Saprolegnia parasitica CBS 223.65]KDO17918.1 hypothetical protein SPRG_16555 [Saprolegnia parasitica CBS 223.65]|eukprot:XP_012211375.1 hypothetical protein SPRG_16555 [Saprolegnia parasitica CBS 223.65]